MIKQIFLTLSFITLLSAAQPGYINYKQLQGGAHPNTYINVTHYSHSSPEIGEKIFTSTIKYTSKFINQRARNLENYVSTILLDGKKSHVVRNGYQVTPLNGKYEGDSGIDGLFRVDYEHDYYYLIVESKYSASGSPQFGPGIKKAGQMSTAWIRYVAHNLRLNAGDNFSQSAYDEIKANPSSIVIRALALGDSNGNFHMYTLKGYNNCEFDHDFLKKMFTKGK